MKKKLLLLLVICLAAAALTIGAAAGHELLDTQRAQRYDGGGSENRDDFLHCC